MSLMKYAHKTCPVFVDENALISWHRNEIDCLTQDVMTLALRLMGEHEDSFAPETREVMARLVREVHVNIKRLRLKRASSKE